MKPNQQEKCAHKKNLGESCSQCNEAWNDMTSPHQEGWAERFDKKYSGYLETSSSMGIGGSEEVKSFIRQELTTLHKADCERFREMLDKEVQGTVMEHEGQKFVSTSTREQVAVNQALSNVMHALSKMEEKV